MGRMCIIFESNTVRFDMFSSSGYRAPFVASVIWQSLSGVIAEELGAGLQPQVTEAQWEERKS